jgi:predicted nucleic acid-binding protein
MIYIDANIFIYALAYNEKHPDVIKSRDFLKDVRFNRKEACTTILTWDEVFWHLKRHKGEHEAIRAGQMLLKFPHLQFIELSKNLIEDAQKICEEYHVNPRDAIHGACALNHCQGQIFSNDRDFDNISEIKRIFN